MGGPKTQIMITEDERIGQKAGADVRARTLKLLNEKGPKLDKVLMRLNQALNAKEIKVFNPAGNDKDTGLVYSKGLVAHGPRLTAIKLALELHDAMPKSGVEKAAETIEDVLRDIHASRGNL